MQERSSEPPEIRSRLLALLTGIAPDIDPAAIDDEAELRDQFDFDSMDRLHFMTAISEAFGIDIPEPDYPELAALGGASRYVARRLAG
jgi:acyl carrier protein